MELVMQRWLLLASVVLVQLAPNPAGAEPSSCPAPEPAGDRAARSLYLRGERLYAAGRYRESIAAFSAAIERSGRPQLYFNLANAHERMGRLDKAADLLARYLRCAHPPDADLVGERLRRLRASAAQRPRASCPVAAQPETGALQLDAVVAAEPSAPPQRLTPWLVAGGGALAAALGLAIASDATALPACASPEEGRACMSAPFDPGLLFGRAALVTAAVGMITLTTGAVLSSGDGAPDRDRGTMPWIDRGAIGVVWSGDL